MTIRKATKNDLSAIEQIYNDIHTHQESGAVTIGWIRGVYPTLQTATMALERDDLFVGECDGVVVSAGIINQRQDDMYKDANWQYKVSDNQVMVLHTLVVSPSVSGKGYATEFVKFYEDYALSHNCPYLRIDTNKINNRARALYKKLGYAQVDVIPCDFNGIKNVNLVMLEKFLLKS